MPDEGLEATYLAYLDALNDRRFDDLVDYVGDELTYNDETLTRRQYAGMIAEDARAVPDLRFDPQLLVVADDTLACRLWFTCTPTSTFFGCVPTGRGRHDQPPARPTWNSVLTNTTARPDSSAPIAPPAT